MEDRTDHEVLERRLLRLEERLDLIEASARPGRPVVHPLWPLLTGLGALGCGFYGVGAPNHAYQVLFAGLVLLLLYHRGVMSASPGRWSWPLAMVNFLLLCLLFKFLIGAGTTYPFIWLKVPVLEKAAPQEGGSWFGAFVPDLNVQWRAIPRVTDWGFDLTRVQTFLLIATLAGSLFRFQPFASLTALVLLVVSIPSYLGFQWEWVVPFLIVMSVSLYLQTEAAQSRRPAPF